MDKKLNPVCPACGLAYDESSAFCSKCGYKLDVSDKKILSWKWVFISMVSLILFQIIVMAAAYYLVFVLAGPESFLRNMLVIPYAAIPAAVITGSFIFSYFFVRSSAADLAAGMGIFLLLSNTVNFVFLDSFSFSALAWIPVIAALAYAGAWAAKKLRLMIASSKNKNSDL